MIVIFLIFALVLWNPQFIQLKVTLECWYFLPIIKWRFTLTFITPYLNLLTSAFFYPTAFLISYIFIWTSYLKHLLKDFYKVSFITLEYLEEIFSSFYELILLTSSDRTLPLHLMKPPSRCVDISVDGLATLLKICSC